jgi:hypothetical protein
MSKLPNDCICLFYFQVGWGRGGVVWGWLYLINSLQKKTPKNTDSHPVELLNSFKLCAPVVFVWFWLFFNCGGIKENKILQCFTKHSFLFFFYHKMNLLYSFIISKILVYIFNFFWHPFKFNRKRLSHKLCFISGIFDNIFRWTFFLERDISMIFCGHWHIIIAHCLTLA